MQVIIRRISTLSTVLVVVVGACGPATMSFTPQTSPSARTESTRATPAATFSTSPSDPAAPSTAGLDPSSVRSGLVILLGQVVTMAQPARAEAIAFEDGVIVSAGSRDDVMSLADDRTTVIDLGRNVAYPGFIDAHAHWIGDRNVYAQGSTPEDAISAALSRGWTSISEQWVGPQGLIDELKGLATEDDLPIRVDGYLALNAPAPDGEHYGNWYSDREPGALSDRVTIQGVKITLDNGWGTIFHWQPAALTEAIELADEAGWQVSVHTVSTEAHEMVLDAFEAALGPAGPNPLHHRIEHAIQVTDEQLARMVDLGLVTVVHLDGAAADWVLETDYLDHFGPDNEGEELGWLARWRDFVEAGLHVASATDTPWVYPGFELTDDIGRPFDQIAGGMDGRGRANPETPAWVLDQLLTAEQGLKAVTVDAAYALRDEANRGHLAVGTYADITILSGDVTTLSPDEIRDVDVAATIVGGITEYCAVPDLCPSP
jgi:predicted amidohydrolase YtcJ